MKKQKWKRNEKNRNKKTEQKNDSEKNGPTPELGRPVPRGGVRRAVRAELVGV
jgi:hypothetical protein